MRDERQEPGELTKEELALKIAERKKAEAEAEAADERALIQTVGLGLFILVGLVVCLVGFLAKESVMIGSVGGVMAGVGVGVLTVAQGAKLLGRGD